MGWRHVVLVLLVVFGLAGALDAATYFVVPGVPTTEEETVTVGAAATGITSTLCASTDRVLMQVKDADILFALHGAGTAITPDSGDFTVLSGDALAFRPYTAARFVRATGTNARVKVQCLQ